MALRITGGNLGGRLIKVPPRAVRPTQDRVRAAVFSMLAAALPGARVLDLFAGSGALGLEAFSRGATSVVWVERQYRVWQVLCDNVRALNGGRTPATRLAQAGAADACVCLHDDVLRFLRRVALLPVRPRFTLVLADPPYDCAGVLAKKILSALLHADILASNAFVALEHAGDFAAANDAAWQLWRTRKYGATCVSVLRRMPAGEEADA
ncbi:MAG: 16S rRNA (guanine(966)-N(2))-methyltransferase RsmD [Kiritimatiellia bacterium]|nr:16S rRNA (guanine(966)-N(2))-methyltransferase RsmD [Lentisphaerota bacterium]